MTGERDEDLPLHDEAKARSKWRGGETLIEGTDLGESGPASEVDHAAQGDTESEDPEGGLLRDMAQRPPD